MIKALFEQIATPTKLGPLRLVEVLNWTGTVLNRVDRASFFARFDEGQAVQYFYEPFLQAFDPELRKDLGVWYTPPEIVQYMVARVDTALREELQIEDGLANPNVYVLDPCCGTGAYLVEVLKRIATTLQENGADALSFQEIKKAAMQRVFGFEILPAPFVVAHLQLGLLLQNYRVPLAEDTNERAGVYLTNALAGWEPPDAAKEKIIQLRLSGIPELQEERDSAQEIKREKPILVVLGNPPYNAFAGVSPKEEQGLVEVYKEGLIAEWGTKKFNLDDLYVRFFRLAEQRIAEKTGRGIVCFISNHSWVSDPSFVVLRRNLLLSRAIAAKDPEGPPFYFVRGLSDDHFLAPDASCFPIRIKNGRREDERQGQLIDDISVNGRITKANLSQQALAYLESKDIDNPDADADTAGLIWMHSLAIGYSPAYLGENADGIRQDWPRIPLPDSQPLLLRSAQLGRRVAELLDTENTVQGVTTGKIRAELRSIATISRVGGGNLNPGAGDLAITAGWGHAGKEGVTMPGKGRLVERDYTSAELTAIQAGAEALGLTLEQARTLLGETTCDVYLNNVAYWQNIPEKVWNYTIGGYQVIKKWLSYRERELLGRALTIEEAREVMNMARRIVAILLMEPELDTNYRQVKQSTYAWPRNL